MRSAFSALRCSRRIAFWRRSRLEIGFEKRMLSFAVAITPLCKTLRLKRRMMFSFASFWSFLVTLIAILSVILSYLLPNFKRDNISFYRRFTPKLILRECKLHLHFIARLCRLPIFWRMKGHHFHLFARCVFQDQR